MESVKPQRNEIIIHTGNGVRWLLSAMADAVRFAVPKVIYKYITLNLLQIIPRYALRLAMGLLYADNATKISIKSEERAGDITAQKRYYWLKLQDGFFTSKRIKKLRRLAGGDTYTIIYLKMQLLAMKTDGVL